MQPKAGERVPSKKPYAEGGTNREQGGSTMRLLSAVVSIAVLAGCAGGSSTPSAGIAGLAQSARTTAGTSSGPPVVGGCQMFPAQTNPPSGESWWNTDVSQLPLDPKSDQYIAALPGNLHPDFGENPTYGIPFVIVPASQKKVPVSFTYASQSNKGPYPIPPNAPIEGGSNSSGDRHVLVLQSGTCKLYEMYDAHPIDGGKRWQAGSGALFDLSSNALRPNGWTSADAAGLAITPALIKCAEVKAGAIDHALRVTFNNSQAGYIHPATHYASNSNDPTLPPMGLRFRMKASYPTTGLTGASLIIATAMKKYGMLMADNGSNWYFQGEGTGNNKKTCWNDNNLDQLKNVPNTAFEVVETGPIVTASAVLSP
jgi:hypothetical protein